MSCRAALAAACAGLLLAGCQSDSTPSTPVTATAPAPATSVQRLFTATISDPKTFNPILVTDAASGAAVGDVFDTLVRLNPKTAEVEPWLAERWEASADGTEWTFYLRPGVRWHDGQPLTAADVVFSFDALYDAQVPNSLRHILTIDGKRIQVEALDAQRVLLRLPHPFAPLLNSISVPIVPKHLLAESLAAGRFAQQWGIDTPPASLIGSGPYQVAEYVPAQYLRLRRNPNFWLRDEQGAALPYLEEQTIRIVPNQDTAYLKFLAGEIDIHNARPEEVPDLHAREQALGITVRDIGLDTGTLFVTFNRNPAHYAKNGKRDPRLDWFTDQKFLRALAHSIDKQSMIISCFHGFGKPAVAYLSPENKPFHNPNLEDYAYDLERARALLAEGGYTDRNGDGTIEDKEGNAIEFSLHTNAGNQVREKMCSILKEDWTKLGMKVNYRPLDFALLVEKLDTTFDWDAMLMGFTGGVEPHNAANLLRSSGNLHLWQPNQQTPATPWEAEIDRLLEDGARELDLEKRRQIYWRIQEILHQELPLIQTVLGARFTAFKNTLQNFEPTVWGIFHPERIRIAP